MPGPLTLTFAEIEFLLSARPQRAAAVRDQLRFDPEGPSREVLAAGLASLLARGVCTMVGTDVVPGADLVPIAAGLSTFTDRAEAVGWGRAESAVMYVFSGADRVRLAVYPSVYGQFTIDMIDPDEPVAAQVTRFMDTFTGATESGMVMRSTVDDREVGVAVAVDADGAWFVSDSVDNPDRGVPASREAAVERIAALLGPSPVGADR